MYQLYKSKPTWPISREESGELKFKNITSTTSKRNIC